MPKTFPHTFAGDQISVEFEYEEEKVAFEAAIKQLQEAIDKNKPRETPISGFKFKTTLQAEVTNRRAHMVNKIIGSVFNSIGDNEFYLKPLPAQE